MRAFVVSAALFVLACGPDPNAVLPGMVASSGGHTTTPSAGGAAGSTTPSAGGAAGSTPASGGTAGSNPFAGSSGSGGVASSGGVKSSGGVTSSGGVSSSGGTVSTGGTSVASTTYTWGVGAEPCASPKDISCAPSGSGSTGNFNSTTEFCFRTAAQIAGWGCSNNSGWTLKVNGQVTSCGGTLPAPLNGLYYFDFVGSSSAVNYASMYWYGTCTAGPFPSWSGGTTSTGGSTGTGDAGTSG